ncbi:HD domain-containing protein [Desulfobotulus sp.]|uniref:HD domain-containing protein n=1 Tax=Desulfobotulus sp. TaxID=1940337 RepID=UPI002A370CAB|nr:HD domain-containing protein [Desulfobotulus sp.]MDY0161698.1 HD domain-containing protein [Desulfobotulus sp.]
MLKIYAVGGAVRDRLLGRPVKDRDFVVLNADEATFLKTFPAARRQGRETPVYRIGADEYVLSKASSIEEDLEGRDLTINALAEDENGTLFSHPLALADLEAGILRPVRKENFLHDPLRVMRAGRFAAFFPEFEPALELKEAMTQAAAFLHRPAPERVAKEVLCALGGCKPSRFFRLLAQTQCLDPWFPEMKKAIEVPAGPFPYHTGSLFEHLMAVVDTLHGKALLGWMGLCHDLGKLATSPEKWPSHHGHDRAGEVFAREFARRLRLSSRFTEAGVLAARHHMHAGIYDRLRPGTRVDLLCALLRADLVESLFRLVRADHGEDFLPMALEDLQCILSVHLPEDHGLTGKAAGVRLRDLRSQALSRKVQVKNSNALRVFSPAAQGQRQCPT